MSSQHFLSAFQRKHHISLKQVKISLKTLFSVSEIPKNFTLCNYFLFQRLSRTICLAFFEKIIFDNMRPPYDVLNLYHVIRLNWSNFLNRPRARARARFFCFLYCLFPRSHYCARPMRFGLKASTEKAWKDTGKSFKNANSRKKSEAPGYVTTQAVMSSGPMPLLLASPWVPEVFFFSRGPTCAERCAPSVPKPRNFSRPHFEDWINTKTYCKTGNRACSAFSVGIIWVGISVSRARSGFCVKRRKTTEDFAQCEPRDK